MSETLKTRVDADILMKNISIEILKQKRTSSALAKSTAPFEMAVVGKSIDNIQEILDSIALRNQENATLPPDLSKRFPFWIGRKTERFIIKIYNYAFRKQRNINTELLTSIQYLVDVNQQLSDRIERLERFLEDR